MTDCEPSDRSLAWHKRAQELAQGQRKVFAVNVGMEPAVFGDCMWLLEEAFEQLVKHDAIKNPRGRALLGILGYAYQLLLGAWTDVTEGRVGAAADHWRTITEAPDYMTAVWLDESYAKDWSTKGRFHKGDTKSARDIVQEELNARRSGLGDEWHTLRGKWLKELQSFSHLSMESAGLVFARSPGARGTFFVPQGFQDTHTIHAAGYLAFQARNLLSATAAVVGDILGEEWMKQVDAVLKTGDAYLRARYGGDAPPESGADVSTPA
jgi:hypothetical protein